MARWIWVADDRSWVGLRGGQTDAWTCDPATRPGDVALLYRTDPAQDLAWIVHVDGDPEPGRSVRWPDQEQLMCAVTLVHELRRPIKLHELRADPVLGQSTAVLMNMHNRSFAIEPREWAALLKLADPGDRLALKRHGGRGI